MTRREIGELIYLKRREGILSDISDPKNENETTEEVMLLDDNTGNLLFAEESLASAVSKATALEGFLNLVNRDIKFSEFVREILLIIMQAIRSEAGSIFELDRANKSLFFRAVIGQSSDQVQHFIIPMGQGVVGHVAESKQPLVVQNIEENKIHLKSIQNVVGFETRNLVAVPILVRGQLYGVLELLNRLGEEAYTPADIELLTCLCNMASKIIEIRMTVAWALKQGKSDDESRGAA